MIESRKDMKVRLDSEAFIKDVELDGIYYDEDEYAAPSHFWAEATSKDYGFEITGRICSELKIDNVSAPFDCDIDFIIKGEWSHWFGYSAHIEIVYNDVMNIFFSKEDLKKISKDAIMQKNLSIAEMALRAMGDPPTKGQLDEVTHEWISHAELI